jgi:hypothetical protein
MPEVTNRNGVDQSLQPSIAEAVTLGGGDITFDQPRTLYIGVTGDLDVTLWGTDGTNGGRVTYENYPVGDFPRLVKTIHDATTTASSIVSEY